MTAEEIVALKESVGELAERLISYGSRNLTLERPWQYDLFSSTEDRSIYEKPRQVGYSFSIAGRSMLRAQLFPSSSYTGVFVSINREEAREKIRYVSQLYDSMPKTHRKKMTTENKLEVEFVNGNRIISYPARAVRGLPNVDLCFDEFAHIREARKIYDGSTASTIRGDYGITIGSTPYGRCFFDEILKSAGIGEYKRFKRHTIYWWDSPVLCTNVPIARLCAPAMTTIERVNEFATERLLMEFESTDLASFQREFESNSSDFGNSVLNNEQILDRINAEIPCEVMDADCSLADLMIEDNIKVFVDMMRQERSNLGRGSFREVFMGVDVGREVNATEIILGAPHDGKLETCAYITLRRTSWPYQKAVIRYLMDNLPIKRAAIDHQGIGNQLSEEMFEKYSSRVYPMDFTETSKADMVSTMLKFFEDKKILIYPTQRIMRQLTAVKKVTSVNGRILYHSATDRESGGDKVYKTHADLFWAMAQMIWSYADYTKRNPDITKRSPGLVIPSGMGGIPVYKMGMVGMGAMKGFR